MQDLGVLHYILGLEIYFWKGHAFISQNRYALSMLKKFQMKNSKGIDTPMEHTVKVPIKYDEKSSVDITLYRSLIGSLIWLTVTRPNLSFCVHKLSQHMQDPKLYHWKLAKRVLGYISSTLDYGLLYKGEDLTLIAFLDSDFAGDRLDRKSTSAYTIFHGGDLVSWISKKQATISLSSCEVEYKSLTTTTKEVLWIKRLLLELKCYADEDLPIIKNDIISVQALANNLVFHARSKHIEVAHHFVREKVIGKEISLEHVEFSDCVADFLTKPLLKNVFIKMRSNLGLISKSMLIKI
ncbi:hypothetical protein O6H91_06G085900 [Diphasiastrum complanatum]|uniref:Uncharacterized protein n=1 Tax=Diphasiastrum complanatum TaxID=34168 RepID=A0ACC2DGG0_DIPCM|nr:hypothetical protein O6H91_06G085900 [Diphasiastrum complanatum]